MTSARQTQVQLGLAAPGDAVQQHGPECLRDRRFFEPPKSIRLLDREHRLCLGGLDQRPTLAAFSAGGYEWIAERDFLAHSDESGLDQ
jgi:hypothetical protein